MQAKRLALAHLMVLLSHFLEQKSSLSVLSSHCVELVFTGSEHYATIPLLSSQIHYSKKLKHHMEPKQWLQHYLENQSSHF